MGFGVTGFIKAATQKALIRYIDPDAAEKFKEETGQDLTFDTFNVEGDGSFIGDISASIKSSISGFIASFIGLIQEIRPDVKKTESHRYKSDVTQYAVEDGTIFSQHIIQQPVKVSLQFEETNAGKMIQNIVGSVARAIADVNKKTMFDQLVEIWERKIPVEIVTENKIYKNMVVETLPITQKSPYKGALQVMVDFVQLSTFSIDVETKKGKTESINKAASNKKDGGRQQLQSVSSNTPVSDYLKNLRGG